MSHHVSFNDLPQGGEKFEPAKGAKLINALGGVGLLGLAASAYYFFTSTATFAYSWLFAIFFAFTFCVGGVFWIMLHAASNSKSGQHGPHPRSARQPAADPRCEPPALRVDAAS